MKSKAHIRSHPLHPILVNFPVAFFIGTFVFDILYVSYDNPHFAITAKYLNIAGIIGAILAAVPGIIDYRYTVPPNSSAKKRAAIHGTINSSVLILFIVILFFRQNKSAEAIAVLDVVGIIALTIGSWMGGTLVHRNQIGIDIRYADAGKWKEKYFEEAGDQLVVAGVDELKVNQMMLLHISGRRVVLGRTESGFTAFDDRCTHKGASLAAGALICGTVQCPWHGSQFNTATGAVTAGPAADSINVYPVLISGEKVIIKLTRT